jgi:uncharacterized protein (PEP-CTERM system associated)
MHSWSYRAPKFRRLARTSALALALAPASSWAGEWTIVPGISLTEAFTDNSTLATGNQDRNSEWATTVSPAISIRGEGARLSGLLDYSLDATHYKNDTFGDSLRNNLTANGHAELWEDSLFLDAQGSISRRVISSAQASSTSTIGQENNRTTVGAFNVTPSYRHHFGTWADAELRADYRQVSTTSDEISDTSTFEQRITANTGREFGRLQAGIEAVNSKTAREGRFPALKFQTVDTTYSYALTRQVAMLWGVGYEDYEDPTLRDAPSGVTWNVGTALTPDSRTSVRFTGGERYGETNFSLDASYQVSARTTLTAGFIERIQTNQQQINEDLTLIGVDAQGRLINSQTGQPFEPGNDDFDLQNNTVRSERFFAGINGTRGRNTFNLLGTWETRDTEATGIEQTVIGGTVSLGRQLTPRTRGSLVFDYANTDFGTTDGRSDDRYLVSALLSYTIFRNTALDFNYSRTQRVSSIDANDMTENAAFVRLSRIF